jgi:para-nitrobenzyl esterase
VLGGIAASCAGLAGAAIASSTQIAATTAAAQPAPARGHNKGITSNSATVVETSAGKIRGYERNGVYTFKGVPYGASTSGANRFMPPAKPEPWAGIFSALAYSRTCPQDDSEHYVTDGKDLAPNGEDLFLLHRDSVTWMPGEDCLRVNVWTPEINGNGKRPVMVFMHGGGYSTGCSHELLSYDGENLARNQDVVLVSHNHRLNVYGYLNLAALGGDDFAMSANVGMLDLVAVLEWVRDNISRFGGDPGNVTIFGQSGGGGKVVALMAMPSAKGLFHRAINESGPFTRALAPEFSQQVAENVLAELGIAKSQFRDLQKVPVDKLSAAAVNALKKTPRTPGARRDTFGETGWWGPTVDGHSLPAHPFDPVAPAVSANVPLITGTCLHESVNGKDKPNVNAMASEEMTEEVRKLYSDDANAIIAAYKQDYPGLSPFNLYAVIATAKWRIPQIMQAERKAALGAAPAYSYIYSWRTPVLDDRPGPFHAAEIAFVFDNADLCDHYTGGSPGGFALAKQMSTAWATFARTGNPNHSGMPHWPAYTAESRANMIFNTPCEVRNHPEQKGLDIIGKLKLS